MMKKTFKKINNSNFKIEKLKLKKKNRMTKIIIIHILKY